MTITIYSKNNCGYCVRQKRLAKAVAGFEEKSLEKDFNSGPSKLIEDIGKNIRTMLKLKLMS